MGGGDRFGERMDGNPLFSESGAPMLVQESNFQNVNDSLDQALDRALDKSQTNNLSSIMGSFDVAVRRSDLNEDRYICKQDEQCIQRLDKLKFEEEPTLQFSNI